MPATSYSCACLGSLGIDATTDCFYSKESRQEQIKKRGEVYAINCRYLDLIRRDADFGSIAGAILPSQFLKRQCFDVQA